jgi:hypothetical protein
MERYAIIKDGIVVNTVEYEGQPTNPPAGFEDGHIAIQTDEASIGWVYVSGIFTNPNPVVITEITSSTSLTDMILDNPTELAKLKQALGIV